MSREYLPLLVVSHKVSARTARRVFRYLATGYVADTATARDRTQQAFLVLRDACHDEANRDAENKTLFVACAVRLDEAAYAHRQIRRELGDR